MIPGCDITSITVDIVTDVKEDIHTLNNDVDEINERIDDLILDQYPVNEFSSTPIATITDAAENIPMKSLIVDIVPKQASGTPTPSSPLPISGTVSITVTHTGKNLFDIQNATIVNGTIGYTFTYSASSSSYIIPLPKGDYVISLSNPTSTICRCATINEYPTGTDFSIMRNNYNAVNASSAVFNVSNTIDRWLVIQTNKINVEARNSTIQVEKGTTATTYEPYTATTHTINLPSTVYGAEVDVVSGSGRSEMGIITYNGSDDEAWGYDSVSKIYYIAVDDMKSGNFQRGLANWLATISVSQTYGIRFGANNTSIYLYKLEDNISDITTLATFKTYLSTHNLQICYPLATPTTITTTPTTIKTQGGTENILADCGNVEGEYYVDPSYKEITGTLSAGETSITLYSSLITSDSTLDFYADKGGVNYTDAIATDGSVTITFEPQASDIGVKVKIS